MIDSSAAHTSAAPKPLRISSLPVDRWARSYPGTIAAMRAVRFDEFGGPEVLHVEDVEEPHAGPGQIRVAVRATAVNPFDWKVRQGMVGGELPKVPGLEAAGVVDEVGDGVEDVSPGDEVFGFTVGGSAA